MKITKSDIRNAIAEALDEAPTPPPAEADPGGINVKKDRSSTGVGKAAKKTRDVGKQTAAETTPQERTIATKVYEYMLGLAAEPGMDLNNKRNIIQIVFDLLEKRLHPGGADADQNLGEGCGDPQLPPTQPLPQMTSDYDQDESQMAKSQLYRTAEYASELEQMIHDGEELDAWVQAKITKASDYLSSVKHYLQYKKTKGDQ